MICKTKDGFRLNLLFSFRFCTLGAFADSKSMPHTVTGGSVELDLFSQY